MDYILIYLKPDVNILADAIQAFRKMYIKEIQLDDAHYVSSPSLTWESGLKITGIDLEIFTDQTKYEMCENEIKDAVASIMDAKYKKSFNKTSNRDLDYFRLLDKSENDRTMVDLKADKIWKNI